MPQFLVCLSWYDNVVLLVELSCAHFLWERMQNKTNRIKGIVVCIWREKTVAVEWKLINGRVIVFILDWLLFLYLIVWCGYLSTYPLTTQTYSVYSSWIVDCADIEARFEYLEWNKRCLLKNQKHSHKLVLQYARNVLHNLLKAITSHCVDRLILYHPASLHYSSQLRKQ